MISILPEAAVWVFQFFHVALMLHKVSLIFIHNKLALELQLNLHDFLELNMQGSIYIIHIQFNVYNFVKFIQKMSVKIYSALAIHSIQNKRFFLF